MIARIFSLLALAAALAACANDEPAASTPVAGGSGADQAISLESRDVAAVKAWLDSGRTGMPAASPANGSTTALPSAPPISKMIDGLENKLEANPKDMKGWMLLAQSYAFIGQMESAWSAAARATELGADEAELRANILLAHGADPARTGGG